jgi:putative membrane protein
MHRSLPVLLAISLMALPPFAGAQSELGDAHVLHIVVAANQVDIDAGKLARTKSVRKETRAFAEQMIADHNAVNAEASALAKRLRVKPEDNAVSRSLHQDGRDNLASLRGLTKSAAFDRAYIAHEVAYHEAVLEALDKSLLPSATNDELKALLARMRPAFAAHLEQAKRVRSALGP